MDEETLISKVVTGLSQDYRHFMTTWMGTPAAERTFNNLLPRLLAEESIMKPQQSKEVVAMKMNVDKDKANSRPKSKKNVECFHCHKKGHITKHCRSLKKEQGNTTETKSDTSQTNKKFAIMAKTGSAISNGRWLVDTGASEHMIADKGILDNYRELNEKVPIRVGNNDYVYGIGVGSIKVISTVDDEDIEVTITGVMYVPGISDNLFSAGAADEKGLKLCVANGRMEITCKDTVIMVGRKAKGSNLFTLDIKVPVRACVARAERTLDEWHRVLGHLGIAEIQNLQRKDCTSGFKIVDTPRLGSDCGDCMAGKAHQVPHPTSVRQRAREPLERVHIDLVGPVNPPSLGGARYFLLARDEFSTYLHVYFLTSKSQTVDMIQRYINEASTTTQKRVRVIRSDNGSEFRNVAMTR